MKEHCYWPLVSDLNNVLSHQPIALKFMTDEHLPEMWFSFILMFQGIFVCIHLKYILSNIVVIFSDPRGLSEITWIQAQWNWSVCMNCLPGCSA